MSKRALVVIDYTNDFVASEGALTCGEPGQAVDGEIVGVMKEFVDAGDYVVHAVDVHKANDPYHPETALFPTHNVRDTWGRELFGEVGAFTKTSDAIDYMDKTRYSSFAGTDLELRLRARGVTEVHLVGVCTDICVLHTAVDAYNKGFKIVIHAEGVASFDQAGHAWALGHFKNTLGAEVV